MIMMKEIFFNHNKVENNLGDGPILSSRHTEPPNEWGMNLWVEKRDCTYPKYLINCKSWAVGRDAGSLVVRRDTASCSGTGTRGSIFWTESGNWKLIANLNGFLYSWYFSFFLHFLLRSKGNLYMHRFSSVQSSINVLTYSNCFKWVEAELLAWIIAWPWLNIVHITKPSENISLNIEQLENNWFSGAKERTKSNRNDIRNGCNVWVMRESTEPVHCKNRIKVDGYNRCSNVHKVFSKYKVHIYSNKYIIVIYIWMSNSEKKHTHCTFNDQFSPVSLKYICNAKIFLTLLFLF